jgi:hypothetical protein
MLGLGGAKLGSCHFELAVREKERRWAGWGWLMPALIFKNSAAAAGAAFSTFVTKVHSLLQNKNDNEQRCRKRFTRWA